ncbi:AIPR family protein [Cryptosporangium sp. NPDC048952]|uniref:AIPR family protein n=1 Tax=Cryptosporangium sp. NPDC048952 TaxID=3363961 RepID=UPI003718C4C8
MDIITQGLTKKFQAERGLDALKSDEAFEAFAGFCVLSQFYEDEFDPDDFRMGAGGDMGIDVAGVIVNGELFHDAADVRDAVAQAKELRVRFVLVQAKTTTGWDVKVFTELADNLEHLFTADPMTYPHSDDVRNLRECIDAVYADVGKLTRELPTLSVHYVSTGAVGDLLLEKKRVAAAHRLEQLNRFEHVDVHAVGAREVRELYKRATDLVSASFTMPKRITLPKIPGVDQAFLGVLSAAELVDRLLTDPSGGIRRALFYENVRDFQDYNAVNQEIQKTLRDEDRRDRFAVLNNGITVVTRELATAGDEFKIRDFQIVNGCQTCHVLFDERESLSDGVNVNIRLIESRDEDVISGIIAATNRQTAVSDDDLSGREEFHKHLEDFFAAQPSARRLFYERRSKQYNARPDVEKTRIITRPALTRAYAAMFLDEPAGVGHYKQLIASRKQDLFQTSHNPLVYYASATTQYRLEWLLRNRKVDTSRYGPARYHILAAIKTFVLGGALPSGLKAVQKACQKLLNTMWDPIQAESVVKHLLPAIDAAQVEETKSGVPLGEMVRTQRFADRVKAEVLLLPAVPDGQSALDTPAETPLPVGATAVVGSAEFEASIATASTDLQDELQRLLGWARSLEHDKIAELATSIGSSRWVLRILVPGQDRSIVSLWNDKGAYLTAYRSVLEKLAPFALQALEKKMPGQIGQGNVIKAPYDEQLLDLLRSTYAEASDSPG